MPKGPRVYSTLSKVLHWIIALLVTVLLVVGFLLADVSPSWQDMAYMLHKSFGLTVLALMVLRISWLAYHGRPRLPSRMKAWQRHLAYGVQWGFYGFLIAMPACGWVMSVASGYTPKLFGIIPMPLPGIHANKALAALMLQCHQTIAWILIGLIALHLLGAIKHQWIDHDRVLRRMWFR